MSKDSKKKLITLILKSNILIPGTISPLFIARDRSVNAIELIKKNDSDTIMLLMQKDAEVSKVKEGSELHDTGVIAEVLQYSTLPNGIIKVLIEAKESAAVSKIDIAADDVPVMTEVEAIEYSWKDAEKDEAVFKKTVKEYFDEYCSLAGLRDTKRHDLNDRLKNSFSGINFINIIASETLTDYIDKQDFIAIPTIEGKFQFMIDFLATSNNILQSEARAEDLLNATIDENKKKYYLSEKIKSIKKEMGENTSIDDFIEVYKQRIASKSIKPESKKKIQMEIEKMQSMSMNAIDNIKGYLDWVTDMPWGKVTKIRHDQGISHAKKLLDQSHYGLSKVKETILEYIALQIHVKSSNLGSVLCLYGPPGIGKTTLAKSIAKALNRKYAKVSLSGVKDEAEIKGHRRTYIGAMPGKIMQAIHKTGVDNPVILLDEIDKTSNDQRGDPQSALLDVLDPDQSKSFQDNYLEVDYDLSNVIFITTINSFNLQKPLLDRMEIISLSSYLPDEKIKIVKEYIVPKVIKSMNIEDKKFQITDKALVSIINNYTKEAGVRSLERVIRKLFRQCLMVLMMKESESDKAIKIGNLDNIPIKKSKDIDIEINENNLKDFLGCEKYRQGYFSQIDQVGCVNGLAYTQVGGDVLPIEAIIIGNSADASSKLLFYTGNLGDVMKESIEVVKGYLSANAKKLKISESKIKNSKIQIHAPEGAVPKDGPSAGIAILTLLTSLFLDKKIKSNIAMTGEFTLHGRVLPIGGLREKLTAAFLNGIKTVLIPYGNIQDLENVPESILKNLTIIPCKTADDVLKEVFSSNSIAKTTKKPKNAL